LASWNKMAKRKCRFEIVLTQEQKKCCTNENSSELDANSFGVLYFFKI
jgi:hypothetical protein